MKNTYKIVLTIVILSSLSGKIYAQTGINTSTPTSTLDVNGTTHIQKELLVGGNDTTIGEAGEAGQFLVSQGEGKPPAWKTVTVQEPEKGDYVLLGTISRSDTKGGLKFIYSEESGGSNYETTDYISKVKDGPSDSWIMPAGKPWKEFDDFRLDLPAFEYPVRLVVNIQMTLQSYWPVTPGVTADNPGTQSYAVAIFKDGAKPYPGSPSTYTYSYTVAVRTGVTRGVKTPTDLFTMVVTLDDIPVGEATTYRVLGVFRNISNNIYSNSNYIVFGRDLDNTLVDQSNLKRATMRVDVFQKVK